MNQEQEAVSSSTCGTEENSKILSALRSIYINADGLVETGKELEFKDRVQVGYHRRIGDLTL